MLPCRLQFADRVLRSVICLTGKIHHLLYWWNRQVYAVGVMSFVRSRWAPQLCSSGGLCSGALHSVAKLGLQE